GIAVFHDQDGLGLVGRAALKIQRVPQQQMGGLLVEQVRQDIAPHELVVALRRNQQLVGVDEEHRLVGVARVYLVVCQHIGALYQQRCAELGGLVPVPSLIKPLARELEQRQGGESGIVLLVLIEQQRARDLAGLAPGGELLRESRRCRRSGWHDDQHVGGFGARRRRTQA